MSHAGPLGFLTRSSRRGWLGAMVALLVAGGMRPAGAAPVVIGLLPDPDPPATVREADAAASPPRIADPLSLALLFSYADLHRPERIESILRFADVSVDPAGNVHLQSVGVTWSGDHIANQRALGEAVRAYRRAQGDVFARQDAIDRHRSDLVERGRQMTEATAFLLPVRLVLKPYDPASAAFPATRFLQNVPKSRTELEDLGALCHRESSGRDEKVFCLIFDNIRPVMRPSRHLRGESEFLEDAPLGYIPFEDRGEARSFAQALQSGHAAATYLLVKPLTQPRRVVADARFKRNLDGAIHVRATRLIFADRAGRVLKSFVVPERAVASDGLPVKLPAAGSAAGAAKGGAVSPEARRMGDELRGSMPSRPAGIPRKSAPAEPARTDPVIVSPK